MPTTNSRYNSYLDRERSLNQGSLRRALQHSAKNGASPLGLRQLPALGLDFRWGKAFFNFCSHTVSLVRDRPRKAYLSAGQWLSRSGKPTLQRRWWQTYLRIIRLRPPLRNLERDCFSAPRGPLRQRKYGESVRDHGEDVHCARLGPAL